LRGFLSWVDSAKSDGSYHSLAESTASAMNQGFEYARDAVTGFYQAIRKVRDTLQALRDAGYGDALDRIGQGAQTAAKYLLYMYLATRALKMARAVGTGIIRPGAALLGYGLSAAAFLTSPFRRSPPAGTPPGTSQGRGQRFINFLTGVNPAAVQPVLVTNWPTGGLSGTGATDTSSGGRQGRGRRKRGPGRGRPVTPPLPPSPVPPSPSSGGAGFWGRMMGRA
ncbi:tail tape measure protein, partial [Escherichia coli]|nr:tail tape measure protein [Escherichia coli]MBZ8599306.1 tail tape measure protein [Escherichia coli]MBZ8604062.1 tail tape measure protein [Escherichia coli]MBZ8604063.1 tail tape measure protein [Escherichia coli]MBZ8613447.1 tail tape measure protein [Escherichia coli]